ncbi:hypothetical protein N7478_012360 [Penicillium angulare]|uniref:uncharacterized protein n=1 Tax=Penicillium angulare TaxID=116970 RepID=UPI00253FEA9E|nr:uncharacterized protein N7478_012360 [Penicillium angulare]KAJ5259379.1 hypothetical protein N7478_012360 [Penicillium angulare]
MPEPNQFTSPAHIFLEEEVYRLGTSPGLRSLPPGPSRDFVVMSWGPIIYRTCYKSDTKHLLPNFLRYLNDAISRSLGQTLTGSEEQLQILIKTYSSKLFSAHEHYADLNEDGVRQAFHDYKVTLSIPATELPSRLRACLMVDDAVFSQLKAISDLCSTMGKDMDLSRCWVKVVEDNFPDLRLGERPYVVKSTKDKFDGEDDFRGVDYGGAFGSC